MGLSGVACASPRRLSKHAPSFRRCVASCIGHSSSFRRLPRRKLKDLRSPFTMSMGLVRRSQLHRCAQTASDVSSPPTIDCAQSGAISPPRTKKWPSISSISNLSLPLRNPMFIIVFSYTFRRLKGGFSRWINHKPIRLASNADAQERCIPYCLNPNLQHFGLSAFCQMT